MNDSEKLKQLVRKYEHLRDTIWSAIITLKAQQDAMHGQDFNAMDEAIKRLEESLNEQLT